MCLKCTEWGSLEIQDTKITQNAICETSHHFVELYLRNWDMYRQSEKVVKQQYLLQMYPQYGELRPTNGWDRFGSLGHPSKFQRVSRLGFVTAATSLTGGQPNLARRLAVSCAGTLLIHFRSLASWRNFARCKIHFAFQVLHSPILAALLHGTRAAGVSQNLRRATRNKITELSNRGGLYSAGWPSHWASAHILVLICCFTIWVCHFTNVFIFKIKRCKKRTLKNAKQRAVSKARKTFFTARRSYASVVLGVVILSVRLSVCHTRALWLIKTTYRWYFLQDTKGQSFSATQQWLVGDVPFHL